MRCSGCGRPRSSFLRGSMWAANADQRATQGNQRGYYSPKVATRVVPELLVPFARFLAETVRFENTHGQECVHVRIAAVVGCLRTLDVDPDGHALPYKGRYNEGCDRKEELFGQFAG
jgi:hypothetical protein